MKARGRTWRAPLATGADTIRQDGVAVAWHFTRQFLPELVSPARHPVLERRTRPAEALPAFAAAPHGLDAVRV